MNKLMNGKTVFGFRLGFPFWGEWRQDESWEILPSYIPPRSYVKYVLYYANTNQSHSWGIPKNWVL